MLQSYYKKIQNYSYIRQHMNYLRSPKQYRENYLLLAIVIVVVVL